MQPAAGVTPTSPRGKPEENQVSTRSRVVTHRSSAGSGTSARFRSNQGDVARRWDCWRYVIEDPGAYWKNRSDHMGDLDQFVTDLLSRGINARPIKATGDAGRKADVTDVDGNMISWSQVAAVS